MYDEAWGFLVGGWWGFLWFCFGGAYFCEVKVLKTLAWYPFSGSI